MQQGNTKERIVEAYIELESERPVEKITVTALVERSRLTRKTFYYYFKDIYDLLEWVYTNEATKALGGKKTYETWQQGFKQIFQYILNNKEFVLSTFNSVSREYLERYLYNEVYLLLIGVVEEKAKGIPVREKDKSFIADFYKYAFVGIVLDWIRTGMKEEADEIIERLDKLIYGNMEEALERYRTDKMYSYKK